MTDSNQEPDPCKNGTMSDFTNGSSPDSALPSSAATPNLSENNTDLDPSDDLHTNGSVITPNGIVRSRSPEVDAALSPYEHPGSDHVIQLSSIEHCMPRSYIRICFAYRLPSPDALPAVVEKLNHFIRKTVDAKPYLSGYVVAVDNPGNRLGAVEIRFSDTDFLEYPHVSVRQFTREEFPYTYDEICERGLPPSVIKPELVSALGESADEHRAPVFRVQANIVEGGIIVSVYLHHCISDGTGFGLLASGSVLNDDFAFDRHLDTRGHDIPSLSMRLDAFATRKSIVRRELSYPLANQITNRELKWRTAQPIPAAEEAIKPRGRGCVFAFPECKLEDLKRDLLAHADDAFMTRHDALLTLIWHGMTKARVPSVPEVTTSKLLIPVDIRRRLKKPLSESYFGAAVDFASVEMPVCHLADNSVASMTETALAVRKAINAVDEPYIRQAIALATYPNPKIDVRDLQASNMDRTDGADMYITSWLKLKTYESTFEMDLGRPDWVRKPWSKDPGSCIILPYDDRKDYLEAVIQMAEADMARLLEDPEFMGYVSRCIE
ncbi:uncharacterized protein Z520_08706 [Fonsecaea multimorphosa CBS 102226]|uniref:Trichothecene 3-O-acetyltransferase-like N-terminal domain-containing protein n=1 Tax=Fonsecaea multimorphosa CBS 102226 TaxID=1442371 RepID=A0A0D2IES0_9EURO|nr:uncharacterized protein Z520_08706 [Fonsecaea multimorphosa CBS 102226]KIX95586.1 hypothetical protein Z520_08706 [Fonsecaea multimorphosa CBS 102226]